jgi:hypothetical protein
MVSSGSKKGPKSGKNPEKIAKNEQRTRGKKHSTRAARKAASETVQKVSKQLMKVVKSAFKRLLLVPFRPKSGTNERRVISSHKVWLEMKKTCEKVPCQRTVKRVMNSLDLTPQNYQRKPLQRMPNTGSTPTQERSVGMLIAGGYS